MQPSLGATATTTKDLLIRPSTVNKDVIDAIPARLLADIADEEPSLAKVEAVVSKLKNSKAAGEDDLAPEIFKYGGLNLARKLHNLFVQIWRSGVVPQHFKDATIVTICKNKGCRAECGNYRGISLLSIAGKILEKMTQSRIVKHLLDDCVSESQCGFRTASSTIDMLFTTRELQEKCIEQNMDLFVVFIDLTKAFDTVNREALWIILTHMGCPRNVIAIIHSLHDGMVAQVRVEGKATDKFAVTTRVRQGCVIAPIMFVIYFAAMLQHVLANNTDGVYLCVADSTFLILFGISFKNLPPLYEKLILVNLSLGLGTCKSFTLLV